MGSAPPLFSFSRKKMRAPLFRGEVLVLRLRSHQGNAPSVSHVVYFEKEEKRVLYFGENVLLYFMFFSDLYIFSSSLTRELT